MNRILRPLNEPTNISRKDLFFEKFNSFMSALVYVFAVVGFAWTYMNLSRLMELLVVTK